MRPAIIATFLLAFFSLAASAADLGRVENQFFTIRDFRLTNGTVMPEAKIAYETYGTLAPNGLNALLITHGPPQGILDLVPRDMTGTYEHMGCEELLLAVERIKPKLHVFGHIHEGDGVARRASTTFVNACVCDAAYRPINEPVIISDVV